MVTRKGKNIVLKAIRAKWMKNRPHVFEIARVTVKFQEILMIYCSVHRIGRILHNRTYVRAENKRVSISQTDELLGSKRYCNVVFDSPILSKMK
jgi:hypothetical protein